MKVLKIFNDSGKTDEEVVEAAYEMSDSLILSDKKVVVIENGTGVSVLRHTGESSLRSSVENTDEKIGSFGIDGCLTMFDNSEWGNRYASALGTDNKQIFGEQIIYDGKNHLKYENKMRRKTYEPKPSKASRTVPDKYTDDDGIEYDLTKWSIVATYVKVSTDDDGVRTQSEEEISFDMMNDLTDEEQVKLDNMFNVVFVYMDDYNKHMEIKVWSPYKRLNLEDYNAIKPPVIELYDNIDSFRNFLEKRFKNNKESFSIKVDEKVIGEYNAEDSSVTFYSEVVFELDGRTYILIRDEKIYSFETPTDIGDNIIDGKGYSAFIEHSEDFKKTKISFAFEKEPVVVDVYEDVIKDVDEKIKQSGLKGDVI